MKINGYIITTEKNKGVHLPKNCYSHAFFYIAFGLIAIEIKSIKCTNDKKK